MIRASQGIAWRQSASADGVLTFGTGDASVSVTASDPDDGDLADSEDEQVVFTSEALVGGARRVVQVRALPGTDPADVLAFGLFAGGSLDLNSTESWGVQPIGANSGVTVSSSIINQQVTSAGTISGSTILGGQRTRTGEVVVPSAESALAHYLAVGTVIELAGPLELRQSVISPTSFAGRAETNSMGVYVIRCRGMRVTIDRCRIVGTLVLADPGDGSGIIGPVNWAPAIAGYPALMSDGDLELVLSSEELVEGVNGVGNLNPAGAPADGVTDSDQLDVYSSEISGLMYVGGTLALSGEGGLNDPVIALGDVKANSAKLHLRASRAVSGPPGFRVGPEFRVMQGSWARVVE